ncbi:MAG: SpoIID/LytB domain-containing protein [Planctomycetota bacterium]|jgi:stage II sporulation protein D
MKFRGQKRLAALFLPLVIIIAGCRDRDLTEPTGQMDTAEEFWIRVLLADEVGECKLRAPSALRVFNAASEKSALIYRFAEAEPSMQIGIQWGRLSLGGYPVSSREIIILPEEPHVFELNGHAYRGKLKVVLDAEGNGFDAVNLVPLEPYLAGVVGAEMPSYWEPAALEAQTVAARTYCLYIKKRFGSNRSWDVRRTQANQVYLGLSGESSQVWDAVNKTWGQVLVCEGTDGNEKVFPTYYSSTCGGYTEDSQHVFGDTFEALVSVPCPYCREVAKPGFYFWPMVEADKASVTARLVERYPKLKELGEIANIIAARESDYGEFSRVTSVKLLGSTGKSDFLRAEDFRLAVDPSGNSLRSTAFRITRVGDKWTFLSGRGYGHGVGMCQCGAQGMAREGKTAEEILHYYYPKSRIASVY